MEKEYKLKCYEGYHPRINVSEDFILKNKLSLKKSQDEIVDRIDDESNMFGNATEVLCGYLEWDRAKKFYKGEYVEKVEKGLEEKPKQIDDIYEATQDMMDYLIFGYMKSMDERGLSAGRTIEKLGHWMWLLGRDDLRRLVDDDELYPPYGMPALIALTKELGLDVPQDCIDFCK
jgi:hypothetical protein